MTINAALRGMLITSSSAQEQIQPSGLTVFQNAKYEKKQRA